MPVNHVNVARANLVCFIRDLAGKDPETSAWLNAIADDVEKGIGVDIPSWIALDAMANMQNFVERAYRVGWLRGTNPSGWDEQDDVTSGDLNFDNQMREDLQSNYPL